MSAGAGPEDAAGGLGDIESPAAGRSKAGRDLPVLLALFSVVAVGAALRLKDLNLESVWFDECYSLFPLREVSLSGALENFQAGNPQAQPLYAVLLYGWSRLAGTSEYASRLFSILLGLIAIVQVYSVGRRMRDERCGLMAAFLMALTNRMVDASQEIRMYSLLIVLALLSIQAFQRILDRWSLRWCAVHAAVTLLIVWTHVAGVLILLPQGLVLLMALRLRWRLFAWTGLHFAAIASILLWWSGVDHDEIERVARNNTPNLREHLYGAYKQFSGLPFRMMLKWLPGADWLRPELWLGVYSSCALYLVYLRTRKPATGLPAVISVRAIDLLLLWLIVPPCTMYALSRYGRMDFFPRYVIYSAVPLYLIAGMTASLHTSRRTVLVAVFTVSLFVVTAGYSWNVRPIRGPYKQALESIAESGERRPRVYLWCMAGEDCNFHKVPLDFYARSLLLRVRLTGDLNAAITGGNWVDSLTPPRTFLVAMPLHEKAIKTAFARASVPYSQREFQSWTGPVYVFEWMRPPPPLEK